MTKLVEHGDHVIVRQQRRLARCRFGKVGNVVDHRFGAFQLRLFDEVAHPGAAAFVVAFKEVGIEQRHRFAVFIEHLIHAHVRLVNRDILTFFEADAVQQVGGIEHAVVQHVIQSEVRFDLRFIQIVLRLAHLFGIELPIPGGNLEIAFLLVGSRLNVFGFSFGTRSGCRDDITHKAQRRIRRFGHLVLQLPGRIVREAQEFGLFGTNFGQARDGLASVVAVTLFCPVPRSVKQRLAGVSIFQALQIRLLGGVLQYQ
ncbi:hypothetical protein D3C80_320540 [compost metagenome]